MGFSTHAAPDQTLKFKIKGILVMHEAEALRRMVAPRDRRPVMMGGILQVMVTRACDQACFGCTQISNLGGKPVVMTPDEFATAIRAVKDYFGVVGLFGGNPVLSPHFAEYCRILRDELPYERRGIWCNNPRGKGALLRDTFNPRHSNLNIHLDRDAYDQFVRDWPESVPFLKGLDATWPEAAALAAHPVYEQIVGDSRHSSPFVSMQEVDNPETGKPFTESERWAMITQCDVNQWWSALIGVVPGKGLRFFWCEIAYSMAVLHANDPTWPDTGHPVEPGCWNHGMDFFVDQVRQACHNCGVPLKRAGQLAIGGDFEEVSPLHAPYYTPKSKGREVRVVGRDGIGQRVEHVTDYLPKTMGYQLQVEKPCPTAEPNEPHVA